jgi:surface-anchored protein
MRPFVIAICLFLGCVRPGEAARVYSEGHADIGVRFVDGKLQVGLNLLGAVVDGANVSEFAPLSDILLFVPETTLEDRPPNGPGQNFDPIGVPAGSPMYRLSASGTESFVNEAPYLGFGSYLLSSSDFIGNVTFQLTEFSSSEGGDLSIFQYTFPGPTFYVTTANGLGPADSLTLSLGAHDHFHWGFTKPGMYRLEWTAEATHRTLGRLTATGTISAGVTTVVPEVSSLTMIIVAMLMGLCSCYRRPHKIG